jgi:hypothetical protein
VIHALKKILKMVQPLVRFEEEETEIDSMDKN